MEKNKPQVILITGSSSGFGLLTAARLASSGHTVYATMRDLRKKEALLSEINKRGGQVKILPLDVTDTRSISSAIKTIKDEVGYIDVLINNAGYGLGGFFEDMTDEEFRAQMETNFFGVLNVTREVIPLMRQRKAGKIINVSSVAGFSASLCFGAYNSSKFALEGFSEGLRYELSLFGIKVVNVNPSAYRTEIFHKNAKYAKNFDNPQSPYYQLSQKLRNFIMKYVDTSKENPEEVAEIIEDIILQKNPRFRNLVGNQAYLMHFLRRMLPFRLYSWLMLKSYTGRLS